MTTREIISRLQKMKNPKNVAGMARFGINPHKTLGISVVTLRGIAKEIKKEVKDKKQLHIIATQLWDSGFHEARILAGLVDVPELVTPKQADLWVKDFDSWDVCDTVCMNLFDKTDFAFGRAKEWVGNEGEFIRRAGFALMAVLAFHNKDAQDQEFEKFFPLIEKYSTDERNFVRKAVNWALRQIGKRNAHLLAGAVKLAEEIAKTDSKSARWVAKDALRELKNKKVTVRVR